MRIIAILLLSVMFASCYTENKARKDGLKMHITYPGISAELCSIWYPIKEKIVKGKPDTVTNTVTKPGPTIPCPPVTNPTTGKVDTPKVKCPDNEIVNNYINRTDTVIQENTAKVSVLQAENTKLKEQCAKEHIYKIWLAWAAGIGWGLWILVLAIRFFKPTLLS